MAKQEYIEKNQQWLTDKANEPGVKLLDKGILYKVVKNGNPKGAMPNRGSVVTAHYVGKTINGKTFDSSRGQWRRQLYRHFGGHGIVPLQQHHTLLLHPMGTEGADASEISILRLPRADSYQVAVWRLQRDFQRYPLSLRRPLFQVDQRVTTFRPIYYGT